MGEWDGGWALWACCRVCWGWCVSVCGGYPAHAVSPGGPAGIFLAWAGGASGRAVSESGGPRPVLVKK